MSSPDSKVRRSRLVSGRHPPPGTDPIADRIRARRGARGLTPLDANLLHFPAMAGGYNDMLGALRNKGQLPGDVRELMILRIAALNGAAFEWIQHEPIGRDEGLTTGQLYIIRDTATPLPPMPGMFSSLQTTALIFTDALTQGAKLPLELGQKYKEELAQWFRAKQGSTPAVPTLPEDKVKDKAEDLYVEATMIVAGYNMVSRFLVGTDVNGLSGSDVPWPLDRREHLISLPSYPLSGEDSGTTHTIHAITVKTSDDAPWIVFANSLLTSYQMWGWVVPYFIDGGFPYDTDGRDTRTTTPPKRPYNILLHSQRGHGRSSLPHAAQNKADNRQTTIPLLAEDIENLLLTHELRAIIDGSGGSSATPLKPVHSIIGVSQGGAVALAFAASPAARNNSPSSTSRTTRSIVACDTAALTPAGNKAAWAERARLVYGVPGTGEDIGSINSSTSESRAAKYASSIGMRDLADVTVPRWFPAGSPISDERVSFIKDLVSQTPVDGFVAGAQALGDYDVLSGSEEAPLFSSPVEHILLLAGSLDGGGKVGQGLRTLKDNWTSAGGGDRRSDVGYTEIQGSGHLPMVDQPQAFCEVVGSWLSEF